MMTPYELVLLLDIHCTPSWAENRYEAILRQTLEAFRAQGLIAYDDGKMSRAEVTAKGRAFIESVLATPMPALIWRCANGVEIAEDAP